MKYKCPAIRINRKFTYHPPGTSYDLIYQRGEQKWAYTGIGSQRVYLDTVKLQIWLRSDLNPKTMLLELIASIKWRLGGRAIAQSFEDGRVAGLREAYLAHDAIKSMQQSERDIYFEAFDVGVPFMQGEPWNMEAAINERDSRIAKKNPNWKTS